MSRPSVHPVEAPPATNGGAQNHGPRVRMKDVQGMPGTRGGLVLRLCQFVFAVISLCVMVTTSDFPSVTAFRLRNCRVVSLFTIGDGIASTLTFAAASASAGITVLIGNDLNKCAVNHCNRFESATAMAFISWFVASPSFLFNFWSLASQ
ncbi:CASP-like protein 5A2 isoform X2 [Syzygium oleosum]|uniref:CASP-like protein 5A2 isoform X2 n=1 Tax=Syzygium oleosum TaxID=219896 RepID=UPI0011D28C88|nr:CASP-like protein 5A2 isoform X2 [Syzygium oleosum]